MSVHLDEQDAGQFPRLALAAVSRQGSPPDQRLAHQHRVRSRTARTTGYTLGKCAYLPSTRNVQEAIDGLCAAIDTRKPTLELAAIDLLGENNQVTPLVRERVILNGEEVPFNAFRNGIASGLKLARPLALGVRPFDPIVEVELDLPYPTSDPDKLYWWQVPRNGNTSPLRAPWAFQRLRLDGVVSTGTGPQRDPALLWQPRPMANTFLATVPRHLFGWFNPQSTQDAVAVQQGWEAQRPERILVRLRVRSAHVWVVDDRTQKRVYLNAEHLGINGPQTGRELSLAARDNQRAADLHGSRATGQKALDEHGQVQGSTTACPAAGCRDPPPTAHLGGGFRAWRKLHRIQVVRVGGLLRSGKGDGGRLGAKERGEEGDGAAIVAQGGGETPGGTGGVAIVVEIERQSRSHFLY